MGAIRKTASISTLGLINFRSKAELLERARREGETAGFEKVAAELRRLSKAEEKAAKQLARLRRTRRVKKAEGLTAFLNEATPMVKDRAHTLAVEGRKRGRKARKAARKTAQRASAQIREALPTS